MAGKDPVDGSATRLAPGRADRLVLLVGVPVVCLLVGALLPVVARWLLDLSPGLPFRPVFRFVGAVDTPVEIAINLVIWLLVGLAVARSATADTTRLTVTDDAVRVERRDRSESIPRDDVADVFLDGGKLVMLDRRSRQLVRDPAPAAEDATAAVFRAHGYPWRDGDPFADLYRRWQPDTPDLPASVNAVLAAREAALKKKAHGDVRDLADALHKLGYVARDEGSRQYWRPLVTS
jgi:hypothetical protein